MIIKRLITQDIAGTVSSLLCLVHCMAGPFLIGLGNFGLLSAFGSSEWPHRILLVLSVIIVLVVIPASYRVHKKTGPSVLAVVGLSVMIIALMFEQYALRLTLLGSTAVVSAHIWNSMSTLKASRLG